MQQTPPPPPPITKDKKYKNFGASIDDLLPDRPFKDLHNPIIKAIWNVDRFNPNATEKLKELHQLVVVNKLNPSVTCDILHDVTGQPIAQATPLLIACFEGDADVIRFLIENGADPNQPESEHHLTALHILCDAEYHGQTLRVRFYSRFLFKIKFFVFFCSKRIERIW
jgi:ankyrin repeat protein